MGCLTQARNSWVVGVLAFANRLPGVSPGCDGWDRRLCDDFCLQSSYDKPLAVGFDNSNMAYMSARPLRWWHSQWELFYQNFSTLSSWNHKWISNVCEWGRIDSWESHAALISMLASSHVTSPTAPHLAAVIMLMEAQFPQSKNDFLHPVSTGRVPVMGHPLVSSKASGADTFERLNEHCPITNLISQLFPHRQTRLHESKRRRDLGQGLGRQRNHITRRVT